MTIAPARDRLQEHFDRFDLFVNDETGSFFVALGALYRRLSTSGLTPEEEAEEVVKRAMEWMSRSGQQRTCELVVIGVWAALEVFVEDVFGEVCASSDIAAVDGLARVKVSLAEFTQASEEERFRTLWHRVETTSRSGVDRFDEALGLIGVRADVESLDERLRATPRGDMTNETVRQLLREVHQVRNVVLHRGGRADRKLVLVTRGRVKPDQRVEVTAGDVHGYGMACVVYGGAVLQSALAVVGDA